MLKIGIDKRFLWKLLLSFFFAQSVLEQLKDRQVEKFMDGGPFIGVLLQALGKNLIQLR